jgi:hypothetical protein
MRDAEQLFSLHEECELSLRTLWQFLLRDYEGDRDAVMSEVTDIAGRMDVAAQDWLASRQGGF